MTNHFLKRVYSNVVFGMTMLGNDRYWMLKKLISELPAFSSVKKLTFDKGNIKYGESEVGNQSSDNRLAIINSSELLKTLKKDDPTVFFNDFMNLSQMTYFTFSYVFNPFDAENTYKQRWLRFKASVSSVDKIVRFNNKNESLSMVSLRYITTGSLPDHDAESVKNRKRPPICSNYGVIFHQDGREFKLLHYTVKQVAYQDGHVSVILIECDGQKYYKLNAHPGGNDTALFEKVNDNEYLNFNLDDFKPYTKTRDFIGEFSMLLVRSIYPEYASEKLPTLKDKVIFDMLGY